MRLIDADALYEKVDESQAHNNHQGIAHSVHNAEHEHFKFMIHQAPTIEAEPVRHGRWLSYTGTHYTGKENEYGDPEYKEHIFFVCSNCRRKTVVREHFCPNCGADMREEGADND